MPLSGFHLFVIPVLGITAVALAFGFFLQKHSSFYSRELESERQSTRHHSIDGLRGLLALGVFFCHVVANHHFYQDQNWSTDDSRLGGLAGSVGVSCFFLVTAFLFWTKALESEGKLDSRQFFSSRVRRIVPMYFTICGAIVLISLAATDFKLVVTFSQMVKDIVAWLSFTALGRPLINGYGLTQVIDPVYWTLYYEWRFYLFFPLLALCARGWKSIAILPVAAIVLHWYRDHPLEWYFLYGAVAATAIHRWPQFRKICTTPAAAIVAIIALSYVLYRAETAYSGHFAPALAIFFCVVAAGNSFLGALNSRAARFLGMISYSVYLLHAISIFLVFRAINSFVTVSTLSPLAYWLAAALCCVLTVAASSITYRFIEYPFALGHRSRSRTTENVIPDARASVSL